MTSDRPQYQLMLSEVGTIRPAAVILWKTYRLGRDRFELADAKLRIRDSLCRICLIAEPTPDDSPESVLMETMMEGMSEFYSRQLSVNIKRTSTGSSMQTSTIQKLGIPFWNTLLTKSIYMRKDSW
ncbi:MULTISPECIES: recombinase family protein [Gardnerella]|uniref:Resolvase/invertase-type recombinase catalytic domain-containing protein n=3 Tax=Gardnerella pickettii TaxID=2914924 RepID=T2PJ81_9BIFI|nr:MULTISPECIES: recombinase family protein [Gardnerella]EPI50800.1 hypothetical protein HMPREF1577_01188 [Gardnerella pickettii JCP8017A]NSX26570.1 recombinase family protein [Gardnerella vaginalis]PKZ39575.1 resolvase [Gardnerella pickettii]